MPRTQFSRLSLHSHIAVLTGVFFIGFAISAAPALAQLSTAGLGVVRHGVTVNGSNRIEGSLQILTGETVVLNGTSVVTGDLLVPGTPAISFNGNPSYGGTLQGSGSAQPTNYGITGNGQFSLRHVIVHTNPIALPSVPVPPQSTGTRDVVLSSSTQSAGNFSTIRNLTLNGTTGNITVPPGTYGQFTINGNNSITLGVAGATQPSVYNFQKLVFNGGNELRVVGPVIVTVNGAVTANGKFGSSTNPAWLKVQLATGDFTLNGGISIYGEVVAPSGTVRLNGNTQLIGGLACDRLLLNGNNLLRFLALNTPPTANNQMVATNEDTAKAIVLSGTDPENGALTYTLLSQPAHGTLAGAAPNLTYTPELNYHGSDSFTFRVNDGQADSNVATVSIAVTAVNDAPIANSQTRTTEEDTALPIVLSGQDVDGDTLHYRIVSGPSNGTISGSLPQLTYLPAHNFNGPDRITFVVNDGTVDSAAATIAITVGPVNDPPVAVDRAVETNEDTALPLTLGATDPDGDTLTYRIVSVPQHGTLSGNPPNLVYTPAPDYDKTDSFSFRASDSHEDSPLAAVFITIHPINDPPTATEQNVRTTEDTPRPIVLTGTDVDGDSLGFAVVLPPTHGVLTGAAPNLTYTPASDYNGPDSLTFRTADGFETSEVATVSITVDPANDAPKATGQELVTPEDTPISVVLDATDVDGDALIYTVLQPPPHGMLGGTPPNLTYTPAANYHDVDSFVFRVSDGHANSNEAIVQIRVTPVNDSPRADSQSITTEEDVPREVVLTGTDIDGDALNFRIVSAPSHGAVVGTPPRFTYTPASNYNGPDSFTFVVNDGTVDSVPATVSVAVGPVNDAPVTYNLNAVVDEDTSVPIPLWADEYDGDPLTFTVSTAPQHGSLTGTPPNLTYTPAADYHGTDSFAFKANDGREDSNVSIVAVTVRSVNDAPVAATQHRLTPEDSPLGIKLTAADVDGDPLSYRIVMPPAHGSLSGMPPDLIYSPETNFNGEDAFVFRANDGSADSAPATISITVQPVNDLPIANDQSIVTDEEAPIGVTLTGSDVDGDELTYFVVTPPEHGTLSGTPPRVTYSPVKNFNGEDSIRFAINDGTSDSLAAEIHITVRPVNDAPIVDAGTDQTTELSAAVALAGSVQDDGDPPGSSVSVLWSKVSGPGNVTFQTLDAPTSRALFSTAGLYVLRLTATDSQLSSYDEITVTVNPDNHRPVVDAGPDQNVTLPNTAILHGTVSDDGNPIGKPLTTAWSVVSGPGGVTFSNRNSIDTSIFFSAIGAYTVRLTASDGALTKSDDLVVTVLPHNNAPAVNAGGAATGEVTAAIPLHGTITDDGLPTGGHLVSTWTKVSGPGAVLFADPAAAVTTATFSVPGTYLVQLTANDSQFGASDQATVLVKPPSNQAPTVNAGPDQTLNLYNSAALNGVVTDDNLPANTLTALWSKVSGPGDVVFSGPSSAITTATFGKPGVYVLRLTADDTVLSSSDEVVINAAFQNQAPTVEAGADQNVVLNSIVSLNGQVTDDGLPAGVSMVTTWSKVSGPGTVTFANPNVDSTTATFGAVGTYVLQLAASDSEFTTVDQVTIQISASCAPSASGLVGFWRGDDNAADAVQVNNGTFLNGVSFATGEAGKAFSLNGNNFVKIPSNPLLDVGASAGLTIELWINPLSTAYQQPLVEWDASANTFGTHLWISAGGVGNLFANIVDTAGGYHVITSANGVVTAGSFQHVALTYDKATGLATLYKDGQMVVQQAMGIFTPRTTYDLYFGQRPGDYFTGLLDEVSLYRRAVRADEIQSVYEAAADGKCADSINKAPVVQAGSEATIPLGYVLTLQGSVTDDGRPLGGALSSSWSVVSGPGTVAFADGSSPTSSATFSMAGTYVLRLTGSDGDLTANSDVSVLVLPDTQSVPSTVIVAPYQADGWRYKIYPYGTVPANVGAVDFDDSDYSIGKGAFGSGGGCPVQSTVHTNWPLNTEIVLRRAVDLPQNVSNIRVSGTVDNDVQVLINGVAASGFITHENCPELDDTRINIVSTSVVPGSNLFVVRGRDRGIESFIDVKLLIDSPITADAGPDATVSDGAAVTLDGSRSADFSGAPMTYQWAQIAGPTVALNLADPVHPHFTAPASTAATSLTFRLFVNDGRTTSNPDTVVITVLPSAVTNQPPTVNAGADQTLQSSTANLLGSVTDDGVPSPSTVTVTWTAVSGPGRVSFSAAGSLSSMAQFSRPGSYLLRLSASDGQLSTCDEVVVTVPAGVNLPPVVEAGADQVIAASEAANLHAAVSDDGLPNGTLAVHWTQVSGPGPILFANAYAANTTARFTIIGVYVLRATASDSALTGSDDLTITVTPTGNQPPQADAGSDQTISVHAPAALNGAGDDDGLPLGILVFRWTSVSGPGSVSFASANGIVSAIFSSPGQYVLRLSVSDSELTSTDDVTITVLGDNQAPVVSAGANQTVRLTNAATLSGSVHDDGLPVGNTVITTWTKVSGPGEVAFGNPAAAQTSAAFSQEGMYTLQLSATDGALTGTGNTTVTVTSLANTPPSVSVSSPGDQSRALSGTPVHISAQASDDDGSVVNIAFFVNGAKVGEATGSPFGITWNGGSVGSYAITAIATDNEGASAQSASITLQLVDNSTAPPVVDISSPQSGATVTAPTAVIGTISTLVLKSYLLQYRPKNDPCADWVTFASGSEPVTAGQLGLLDPTLLLNGTYEIRLVVTLLDGVSYASLTDVVVDGNMKVGPFTATFKDMELPLVGVPITVTRTYDSRNHCPADFGYGWTLGVDSIRLESSEQIGNAWSLFVFEGNLFDPSYYRLDDAGPHLINVKMPDGQLLRFTPKVVMDRSYNRLASLLDGDGDDIGQVYAQISYSQPVKVIYRARAGASGAVLKARGYRTTDDVGGLGSTAADAQFYLSEVTEGSFNLATRENSTFDAPIVTDVTGWELTLKDGRVLLFDKEGKLEEMHDRVGNKIAFNRDGQGKIERITHTPSGKEIVFTRDGSSRIQSISDPAGNKVEYRYTPNGDLDKVFGRGNDPTANVPNTSFTYKGVTHLLEDVLDARGIRAARNFYDDAGRLFKTVDADAKETTFTHDLNTRTETIKDRAGNTTVHRYDARGNIVQTQSPDGTVTATDYHHWSDGTLSDLKETESVTGLFTDSATPTAALSTRTLTTHYLYEDDDATTPPANDGLLRKLVDPMGHTTTFTYDDRGNVLTVIDANANGGTGIPAPSVTNTYYANGQLQTAADALGHVTTYTYDAKGNPDTETRTVTLTNVDGTSSVVSVLTDRDYNALGQLEKLTDPAGHVTTYEYDLSGNRRFERSTRTYGNSTVAVVNETEYDEQDRPVRTWNAGNPRSQATRPSSETVYDDNGKVAWTYDALGHGTHQEYDSRGLLFKTTHPDATFDTVTYDGEGRREIVTDRCGMATKTVYDAMGRVQNTIFLGDGTDPAVTLSTTAYDAGGRVWQSTDANGHTTSYSYDDAGRRTAVTLPLLENASAPSTTRYTYDNNGNLRLVTDPRGRPTEHVYDALNRRIHTILPAAPIDLNGDGLLGSNEQSVITSTLTSYDELGRRVSETDASNRTKRYGYDVLGRLRHVIDFAGQATRFGYDELGNQLSQTDANNHTTSYTYDNAGRRLTRTLPLGQQELLGYDDGGNLTSRKDFNGRVTTFAYDSMNRLHYRVPDPTLAEPTIEFTYNGNGQRETMRDATGTTIYHYDGRGQLSTKQTPFGTLSYSYYPNGSLKQLWSSNVNGVNTSYSYDAQNRLETVTDPNLGATSYAYDEVGNLQSILYPNAISHQYSYDALNRLELLVDRCPTNIINSWKYVTTGAGQRTSAQETDQRTAWYAYDSLGRLKTEAVTSSIQDGKNGTITYGYDNVGNRVTRTSSLMGVTNQAFSYDASDRLNGDQYDNNGNTITAASSQPLNSSTPQPLLGTDSYDSENRLTERIGANGSTVNLVYDGDGNRVQEIVNGQTKSYLIDDRNPTGYAQVVEEIVNGSVNHTYTYGHDLISQDQVDPATNTWHATFYGYDGHGNARFLANESGQVIDTYAYDAFGTLITATGSTKNRYLYTGEQFDPNLGLYYLRARLMNPLTGRFWTVDCYERAQSEPTNLHKYLYANADPVIGVDPSGHSTLVETVGAAEIDVIGSTLATIGVTYLLDHAVQETRDLLASIAIDAFATEHALVVPTQSDFDELARRVARTASRRRENQIYLHYSFGEYKESLVGLGLLPSSFATKTIYPTGWAAKMTLALPNPTPPDAVYIVWPKIDFAGFGPTTVKEAPDRAGRLMPGGGQQWYFIAGSGGPGTVFGPMIIEPGINPYE
jgi:RHS repeat-associated protein